MFREMCSRRRESVRGLRPLTVVRIEGLFTDTRQWAWRLTVPYFGDGRIPRSWINPYRLQKPTSALPSKTSSGKPSCMTVQKCPSVTKRSSHGVCDPRALLLGGCNSPSRERGAVAVILGRHSRTTCDTLCGRKTTVGLAPVVSGRELARCRAYAANPARPISTQKKDALSP